MKQKNRHILYKMVGLLMLDVATVWMMLALNEMKATSYPWCESYLFLSTGLVNVSMLFYAGLSNEVGNSSAKALLLASGMLWGLTFFATLFTVLFLPEQIYHMIELIGLLFYMFYSGMILFHGQKKKGDQPSGLKVEKDTDKQPKGLDTDFLLGSIGENMLKSRPYLAAEEYTILEHAYKTAAEKIKELSCIEKQNDNLLEIERKMTLKLSEISGQMERLEIEPGEHQRVLITEIITSLEIVSNFALKLKTQNSNET